MVWAMKGRMLQVKILWSCKRTFQRLPRLQYGKSIRPFKINCLFWTSTRLGFVWILTKTHTVESIKISLCFFFFFFFFLDLCFVFRPRAYKLAQNRQSILSGLMLFPYCWLKRKLLMSYDLTHYLVRSQYPTEGFFQLAPW